MAIRIFDNDNFKGSQGQKANDTVGRFRAGKQVNGRPMSLEAWRITTGDPDVAARVSELYGGTPGDWDTKSDDSIDIETTAPAIEVIIEKVYSEMVLWGRKGKIRECDGVTQKDGKPCACPMAMDKRKEAAEEGTGCQPSVTLIMRLVDDPDLGVFRFQSGSWIFARTAGDIEEALKDAEGPINATISLEAISTKSGRNFTLTKVEVHGPALVEEAF